MDRHITLKVGWGIITQAMSGQQRGINHGSYMPWRVWRVEKMQCIWSGNLSVQRVPDWNGWRNIVLLIVPPHNEKIIPLGNYPYTIQEVSMTRSACVWRESLWLVRMERLWLVVFIHGEIPCVGRPALWNRRFISLGWNLFPGVYPVKFMVVTAKFIRLNPERLFNWDVFNLGWHSIYSEVLSFWQ